MEDNKPSHMDAGRLDKVLEPSPFSNPQEDRLFQKDWQETRTVAAGLWTSVKPTPDNLPLLPSQYHTNLFRNQPFWNSSEGRVSPGNLVNDQVAQYFPPNQAFYGQGHFGAIQETVIQDTDRLQSPFFSDPQVHSYPPWNMSAAPSVAPGNPAQTQSSTQVSSAKQFHSDLADIQGLHNSVDKGKNSAGSSSKDGSAVRKKLNNTADSDSASDMTGHISDSIVYHSGGDVSSDQNSVGSREDSIPESYHSTRRRDYIDWNTLKNHFHLPMNEASAKLGVCVTVLKKICRRFGISRWPHRKLKSVARHIERQERAFSVAPGVENLSYDEVLDLCRKRPHKKSRLDSDQESTKSEGDMPNVLLHFGEAKEKENAKTWKSSCTGIDVIAESSVLIPLSSSGFHDIFQGLETRLSNFVDSNCAYKKEFYLVFEAMNRIFDSYYPQKSLKSFESVCNLLKMGMWTCDYYGNCIAEMVGIENISSFDLPFSASTQVMDATFLRTFTSGNEKNARRWFRVLESAESGGIYVVGKYLFQDVVELATLQEGKSDKSIVLWAMWTIWNSGNTRE